MSTVTPFKLDLLDFPEEVVGLVLDMTDIGTLTVMKSVCHSLRRLSQVAFRSRVWSLLRHFELDLGFIQVLQMTDSVIVGDFPLLITFPLLFEPHSLAVIVPSVHLASFCDSLTTTYGYNLVHTETSCRRYRKGDACVSVSITQRDFPIVNMGYATSTMRMTFFSSHGLYIAYPTLSLAKKTLPNVSTQTWIEPGVLMNPLTWVDCYPTLAGWSEHDDHTCSEDWSCPITPRHLYDAGGLFFPLERAPLEPGSSQPTYIFNDEVSVFWGLFSIACHRRGVITTGFSEASWLTIVSGFFVDASTAAHDTRRNDLPHQCMFSTGFGQNRGMGGVIGGREIFKCQI